MCLDRQTNVRFPFPSYEMIYFFLSSVKTDCTGGLTEQREQTGSFSDRGAGDMKEYQRKKHGLILLYI